MADNFLEGMDLVSSIKKYPLFEEINNANKHVCVCSEHACEFCMTKIRVSQDPNPDLKTTYILPSEVAVHNKPDDIWISLLGRVYDITPIIKKHQGEDLIKPLLAFAGKDLSHWFDEKDGDIRHFIHNDTGVRVPYCPYGPIPDVRCQVPATSWRPMPNPPWWSNDKYLVGFLTKRGRPIRIQNMITRDICKIEVCMEDKIWRIQERYRLFNSDCDSYTWLYEDRVLDIDKTLAQNGIPDEKERLTDIGLPENTYIPMLLLYFNDDLKWET